MILNKRVYETENTILCDGLFLCFTELMAPAHKILTWEKSIEFISLFLLLGKLNDLSEPWKDCWRYPQKLEFNMAK